MQILSSPCYTAEKASLIFSAYFEKKNSVDATAVPWLEGMNQRQVRQLELASSQDEEGVASENGGSMKYPQKRQLFRNPFVTNVITASVITSFTATTTTITAEGMDYICIPPGFVECAAA